MNLVCGTPEIRNSKFEIRNSIFEIPNSKFQIRNSKSNLTNQTVPYLLRRPDREATMAADKITVIDAAGDSYSFMIQDATFTE
jgi:hypothetical protein